MRNLLFTCILWLAALGCQPEKNALISGTIHPGHYTSYEFFWYDGKDFTPIKTDSTHTCFTVEIPADSLRFVEIKGEIKAENEKWVYSHPLYITPGREIRLDIQLENQAAPTTLLSKDADNLALQAYTDYHIQQQNRIFGDTPALEEAEDFINAYFQEVQHIREIPGLSEDVRSYLTIGAHINTHNFIGWLNDLYVRNGKKTLPPDFQEKFPLPIHLLDNAIALKFINTTSYIFKWLSQNAPDTESRISLLHQTFHDPAIIKATTETILQHYVYNYRYSSDFDKNLAFLKKMAAGLPDQGKSLIRKLENKKNTAPGSPLPDAEIEGIDGKIYKLSDFKGKFLYIDFWASWCGPCCAEVPYLQQIEKQLKNPEVMFISISLDTHKEEWKKKMKQLNMSGHQFVVSGNKLTQALNISGIPHFMLYDKSGRLMEYQCNHPSSGEVLKQKLEQLR